MNGGGPRPRRSRSAAPITVAVLATAAAASLAPQAGTSAPALSLVYVVCMTLCAIWWLLRLTGSPGDQDVMAGLEPGRDPPALQQPPRLHELEGLLASAIGSAVDAEARLRPRLRELACELLAARRRLDLDPLTADVAGAVGLPGEPLLGPRRPERPAIREPGPSPAGVSRVIAQLEII